MPRTLLPPSSKASALPPGTFKSVPEKGVPRRIIEATPPATCEAVLHSTTAVDTLIKIPTLSLVREPTVEVSKAFTTEQDGARHAMHICNAEPSMRSIVLNNKPVGEGGQSVVYAASNTATGAALVYKQLRSKNMQEALVEALQEANIAHDMQSPTAPMVVQQEGTVGLIAHAMPTDLLRTIKTAQDTSWSHLRTVALEALFDIAAELRTLHSKGYVHCDIKADNVLANNQKRWKLADFGHTVRAKDFQALRQTRGTMAFWAPEVFFGESFSAKSDIYSLGLMFLTVLGGGDSPMMTPDFIDAYKDAPAWETFVENKGKPSPDCTWLQDNPAFANIWRNLEPREQQLVLQMLHPEPSARPSAEELLEMRSASPALQRTSRRRKKALQELRTDSFQATHSERMREVLSPREMERGASYSSGSDAESGVATPPTPRRDETMPTNRRRRE